MKTASILGVALLAAGAAQAAVSAADAAALKSTLTPYGAEKAGNKDGSIPAYSGGVTGPYAGYVAGGRRPDPFAGDKPLYTITGANVAQHADRLSEGTKALLKKYPDYRLDVYKTVRSHPVAPDLAERTFQNATRTKVAGNQIADFSGGYPFPIPKSGEEAMWNHLLRNRGPVDMVLEGKNYLIAADGRRTLVADIDAYLRFPGGYKNFKADGWDGTYQYLKVVTNAPTIRAGEQILVRNNVDDAKSEVYAYLPGQRRVRRLPNACCDMPSAPTAGIANVDDTSVWEGRLERFDWKLLGKKEMFVPYNTNRFYLPAKDTDVIGAKFLNPDHVRWELHRVWVVEAALKAGQRHTSPKSLYYLDEDTWQAEIADRWDAKGQLWKHSFVLPVAMPDVQITAGVVFGFYDLLADTFIINNVMNEKKSQMRETQGQPDSVWQPDAMAGTGIR